MNANESINLFRGVFSSIIFSLTNSCDALSHLTFWSTNWQEAIKNWDVMMSKLEERERQATLTKKTKKTWQSCVTFIPIVVYTNSKKKILTTATVYKTSTCLHALHVNTFWAVKLHFITIGRIMYMESWHLVSGGNAQEILFTSL